MNATQRNARGNARNVKATKATATAAQQVAAQQVATPVADVATPTPATPVPTPRQCAADAGHALASVLGNANVRKALQACIGNVKRSDLIASADDIDGRTFERIERARVADLASMLATAAQALTVILATPKADLRGANVAVRIGSVSVLALASALADANSKADALSQFATA
jgi:hypothetical protein